jgi:hypothetical protein
MPSNSGTGELAEVLPDKLLRLLAQYRDAAHQAALVWREIGAGVQGAAVVPHQNVADPPDVLVDEAPLFLVIEQKVQ